MTDDQRAIFRILLAKLLEKIAAEEWSDDEIADCIEQLEMFVDGMIEREIFYFLNTFENTNYGLN